MADEEREHVLSLDCWCSPALDAYGDEDDEGEESA
jgi:hypothetical protein